MNEEPANITQLLKAWSAGKQGALKQLAPRVYTELRRIANRYTAKEGSGRTLQATALVHEVFLRLVEVDSVSWQDRAHFFAVSANMMRRILMDRARARGTAKRGKAALHINLDDAPEVASHSGDQEIAAIDEAMEALGQFDARKEKVVELRFFGGLSVEETADVFKISPQSVMRLEDCQSVAAVGAATLTQKRLATQKLASTL